MNYPVWRFHKEKCLEGKIIRSLEEDKALGSGWVDSPAKYSFVEQPAETDPPKKILRKAKDKHGDS